MEIDLKNIFRNKVRSFLELSRSTTEQEAFNRMMEGYPERQRQWFGELIGDGTLAEGFRRGIDRYREIGFEMEVVDISNDGMDAVLEIQRSCPVFETAREFGLPPRKVCFVLCDMDVASTNKAFPDWTVKTIARKVDGDCVCIFKHERKAAP